MYCCNCQHWSVCLGSLWEVWIVMIHREFDSRLFRSFTGITTDLSETLDEQLRVLLSTTTRRLRALRLTDTETAILKAFVLFSTGSFHYVVAVVNNNERLIIMSGHGQMSEIQRPAFTGCGFESGSSISSLSWRTKCYMEVHQVTSGHLSASPMCLVVEHSAPPARIAS